MLIFSGLADDGTPHIFEYMIGKIDPEVNPVLEYQFLYHGHDDMYVDLAEVNIPSVDNIGLNQILR